MHFVPSRGKKTGKLITWRIHTWNTQKKRVNLKMDETSIEPTSNALRHKYIRINVLFDRFAKVLMNELNSPVIECEKQKTKQKNHIQHVCEEKKKSKCDNGNENSITKIPRLFGMHTLIRFGDTGERMSSLNRIVNITLALHCGNRYDMRYADWFVKRQWNERKCATEIEKLNSKKNNYSTHTHVAKSIRLKAECRIHTKRKRETSWKLEYENRNRWIHFEEKKNLTHRWRALKAKHSISFQINDISFDYLF